MDKKHHTLHIGTVTNTETSLAVDTTGNLEAKVNFTVEGIDPEIIKTTFWGFPVNPKYDNKTPEQLHQEFGGTLSEDGRIWSAPE